ncbi:hypothetical protein OIV83_002774 [Microbotryomycetes sp. JL201]|nr:hypothetical protein OIV83_002774 [Microbotryomycetes sp. JL201]
MAADAGPSKFSPAAYLRGLGWRGPGTGLTSAPHARSKPVLVAQKKTLSGVGKDRDETFAWWDAVFVNVANKVSTGAKTEHKRTTTGIISPRNPVSGASTPTAGAATSATPPAQLSTSGGINQDAFGQAKVELARKRLYSTFLRGQTMGSTLLDSSSASSSSSAVKLKGKQKATAEDILNDVIVEKDGQSGEHGMSEARKEAKRIRKAIREANRARKLAAKRDQRDVEAGGSLGDSCKTAKQADDIVERRRKRKREKAAVKDAEGVKEDDLERRKRAKKRKHAADDPPSQRSGDKVIQGSKDETGDDHVGDTKALARAARREERKLLKAVKKALEQA